MELHMVICVYPIFNPILIDLEFCHQFYVGASLYKDMEKFGWELKAMFSLDSQDDQGKIWQQFTGNLSCN